MPIESRRCKRACARTAAGIAAASRPTTKLASVAAIGGLSFVSSMWCMWFASFMSALFQQKRRAAQAQRRAGETAKRDFIEAHLNTITRVNAGQHRGKSGGE